MGLKQKKTIIILAGLAVVLFVSLAVFTGTSGERKKYKSYVVLVSFDAFRWDYHKLYKIPNFDMLASDGVKADKLISSFPTNTFPNHYSIATGLYPDHHGLINNTFFAPDLGLLYRIGDRKAVENPAFYGGEPVWITAEKQGAISASFFWVGSEAPIKGIQPTYWKKYNDRITYEERIDSVIKWFEYPEGKRPELVTLYFDEPDATGHDYGPVSGETGEIVTYLDKILGHLRSKLNTLPFAKKINLIVLSDHGMSHVTSERYINIRDIVPERMMKSIYGSNPFYLVQPQAGKKDSILHLLNGTKGIRAWSKDNLPRKWNYGTHPRITGIVAVADSSWYVGTRPFFGTLDGGAHGYDNYNSDMYGIFYATGPAFRKSQRIDFLNNVDIYNLVCTILDLKPSDNDGDMERIQKILK